jgi:hypothetical protein
MTQTFERKLAISGPSALLVALSIAGCAGSRPTGPTPPETPAVTAAKPAAAQKPHETCDAPLGFTSTQGAGRDAKIVRVTTLAAAGPGSLAEALTQAGPRLIVFEVGGVIDLAGASLSIDQPFVTLAGQTAPSPGITLVRGGIKVRTHDVVMTHLRVRPGEAGHQKQSGWEVDGITTSNGARDVIVDHCSVSWATDENLTASGSRFQGATPEAWRAATSHRVTFSNNIVGEGLSSSTHKKGEHSKGSLIHDNVGDVALVFNLFISNVERNPFFKGGARGVVVNNWVVNPKKYAMKYTLVADEWGDHPHQTGQMAVVGNVFAHGPDTEPQVPLLFASGVGSCEVYLGGNIASDRQGKPVPLLGGASQLFLVREQPPLWPSQLEPLDASKVPAHVGQHAGARPWDRDAVDARLVREARVAGGKIIDSELAGGGYPSPAPTRQAFDPNAWDLECWSPQPRSP